MMDELKMFDIVYADFSDNKVGSEQSGIHPASDLPSAFAILSASNFKFLGIVMQTLVFDSLICPCGIQTPLSMW